MNPLDPQSKRLFTPDGVMQTLGAQSENTGQNTPGVCIALDGDKLKPREDQRKGGNGFGVNEDGAGYTLTAVDRHGVAYAADGGEVAATITRQISEQSGQDNRANAVVQCFSKVSHPSAPNGKGERWDEREVAQTRNTFDNGEKRCQEVVVSTQGLDGYNQQMTGEVAPTCRAKNADTDHLPLIVSTNSNGGDVAATINANMSKLGGDNQTTFGGGYVVSRRGDRA